METVVTSWEHHITLAAVLTGLGFFLQQHAIWRRMKERLNALWRDRCIARADEYVPLEDLKR